MLDTVKLSSLEKEAKRVKKRNGVLMCAVFGLLVLCVLFLLEPWEINDELEGYRTLECIGSDMHVDSVGETLNLDVPLEPQEGETPGTITVSESESLVRNGDGLYTARCVGKTEAVATYTAVTKARKRSFIGKIKHSLRVFTGLEKEFVPVAYTSRIVHFNIYVDRPELFTEEIELNEKNAFCYDFAESDRSGLAEITVEQDQSFPVVTVEGCTVMALPGANGSAEVIIKEYLEGADGQKYEVREKHIMIVVENNSAADNGEHGTHGNADPSVVTFASDAVIASAVSAAESRGFVRIKQHISGTESQYCYVDMDKNERDTALYLEELICSGCESRNCTGFDIKFTGEMSLKGEVPKRAFIIYWCP